MAQLSMYCTRCQTEITTTYDASTKEGRRKGGENQRALEQAHDDRCPSNNKP